MNNKSQSVIAGMIFVVVFAGLFFVLMRYGDLNRASGAAIEGVSGMAADETSLVGKVFRTSDGDYTVVTEVAGQPYRVQKVGTTAVIRVTNNNGVFTTTTGAKPLGTISDLQDGAAQATSQDSQTEALKTSTSTGAVTPPGSQDKTAVPDTSSSSVSKIPTTAVAVPDNGGQDTVPDTSTSSVSKIPTTAVTAPGAGTPQVVVPPPPAVVSSSSAGPSSGDLGSKENPYTISTGGAVPESGYYQYQDSSGQWHRIDQPLPKGATVYLGPRTEADKPNAPNAPNAPPSYILGDNGEVSSFNVITSNGKTTVNGVTVPSGVSPDWGRYNPDKPEIIPVSGGGYVMQDTGDTSGTNYRSYDPKGNLVSDTHGSTVIKYHYGEADVDRNDKEAQDAKTITVSTGDTTITLDQQQYSQLSQVAGLDTRTTAQLIVAAADANIDLKTATIQGNTIESKDGKAFITNSGGTVTAGTGKNKDGTYRSVTITEADGTTQEANGDIRVEGGENPYLLLGENSELKTFEDGKLVQFQTTDDKGEITSTSWNSDGSITSGGMQFGKPNNDGYRGFMNDHFYYKDGKLYEKDADGKYTRCDDCTEAEEAAAAALYDAENHKAKEETGATLTQQTWQTRMANFENALTQYQGLSGFSSLFFDDDELQQQREDVDRLFAENYLGTDYWSSEICATDIARNGDGILYVTSPSGMIEVGAHVEGERTDIVFQNGSSGREFLYRLSYYVSNPNGVERRPEHRSIDIKFNVVLYGDRVRKLYNTAIVLEEGDLFNRIGEKSIVRYSNIFYNRICVEFEGTVLTADGKTVSTVCNVMTKYAGGSEGYETELQGEGGAGSGVGQTENEF